MGDPVLLIMHDRKSDPGRVGERLRQRGYPLDVRCPLAGDALPPTLDEHCATVIFGGPMSANDDGTMPGIRAELDWIPQAVEADKPFLGICLGAQLLAKTLGAQVAPHPSGLTEIGYYELEPTEAGGTVFEAPLNVYHWHKEGFELPDDATLLATGERFPHQAFRYRENLYGIQFHPEVTLAMMRSWLSEAAVSLELPGAQAHEHHLEGHGRFDPDLDRWVDRFLNRWLAPVNGSEPTERS